MAKAKKPFIQGSFFEENYLIRSLGPLVTVPDIALTELVANAWDAGATVVKITIPSDNSKKLIVEDNGTGLSKKDFHFRWMCLGYNRVKHQGKQVTFPPGVTGYRTAYGRNGIGRHGLLCFNNEYAVTTTKDGEKSKFVVTTFSEKQPFVIKTEEFSGGKKHGTKLEVVVSKNLPNPDRILHILSARFLHDPSFQIFINGYTVPLENHSGMIDSRNLEVDGVKLKGFFIDSQKAAKSTLYQGIAFWQGTRLVGEPSWILGNQMVVDGRTKNAKRYTVVVKTDGLEDEIKPDWTGFKKSDKIDKIYAAVNNYAEEMFGEIAKENIEETKEQIRTELGRDYKDLSALGKYEVNEAIESITLANPVAKPEAVSLAVQAIINLEKSRTGKELLYKLSTFSEEDADGLNALLDKWSIKDALSVLDEIDNRISVIEAIRKLSGDDEIDELHVLHPLVTAARWLFGPEYDSPEFVSNRQLQTAVEIIFKKEIQPDAFTNHKKRPDIMVLADSTASVTGTEEFDSDSGLSMINKVLLIELKKGSVKLSRKERNQAQSYVEDFIGCGALIGEPYIDAFVLGRSFSEKVPYVTSISPSSMERGKVRICTYAQIVDTAEKRLFGLRQKLSEKYDDIPGMELFERVAVQLSAF